MTELDKMIERAEKNLKKPLTDYLPNYRVLDLPPQRLRGGWYRHQRAYERSIIRER